jgi:phospholipid/cholesterol/gamma-HCH transport system substrate-binding protein
MITQLPKKGVLLAVAAFILASVLLTLFAWRSVGGNTPLEPKLYEVHALFNNASGLTKHADIRIAGISIGKVTDVRSRGLSTEATLAIKEQYAPIPSDTHAILRQKTLLGETFVSLSPGNKSAKPLHDGDTIPVKQIGATQPLDRVLGMLDKPTRKHLVDLLTNTGALLDGRGQDFNASLGNLAIGTRQLAAVVKILDGQRAQVGGLVRNTGQVLQTVGDEQAAVGRLVNSGNQALSATAEQSDALTATISATPALLRELRATSDGIEQTAVDAGPTFHEFRPVAGLVEPALSGVREASPRVTALLNQLNGMLPAARAGLPAASKFVNALVPLVHQLDPTARQIAPVTSYMAAYRKELVATMANVAASTNGASPGTDGKYHAYLRTLLPLGPEGLVGYPKRLPSNRHNAYRVPGGLADLVGGLTSSNCAGAVASNTAAPCKLQPPWSFSGGKPTYYQHVDGAKPPKK